MQITESTAKITTIITEVIGTALIILFTINIYMTSNQMSDATTNKLKMLKAAFALQQSSEDLTKFAGDYIVTGDVKYKKLFAQVSSIRNGSSLRPSLLNSSYWYLPLNIKQDNHPMKEPLSLEEIISELPFNNLELTLIQKSRFESQQLEILEGKIFKILESGNKQEALKVYYSDDYYYSKTLIMTSLDELYSNLNIRFEKEIAELKSEQINSLIRLFVTLFIMTILKIMIPTTFRILEIKTVK
jgi:methyl-accepting chemotaxis protein